MRRAVLLGAGRGVRRLDVTKSYPAALELVADDRTALDWNLATVRSAGCAAIAFVGGYHIEKIIEQHPDVAFFFDPHWHQHGPIASALLARSWIEDDTLLVDAEIVITEGALTALAASAGQWVAGTCDTTSVLDGEGGTRRVACLLIRAGADRVRAELARLAHARPSATLDELAGALAQRAGAVAQVDLGLAAAPVRERALVAQRLLRGKAHTLERLRQVVRKASILEQIRFSAEDWRRDPGAILQAIARAHAGNDVVVRSSAAAEDQWQESAAGRYRSVLDVRGDDAAQVGAAVEQVLASFERGGAGASADCVFVQRQLKDVQLSGVLLTRALGSRAPYFVLNVDRKSQRTDVVTSGAAGTVEKVVVLRSALAELDDPEVRALLEAARELEELTFHDALDIELARSAAGETHVLQVRPLAAAPGADPVADEDVEEEVANAERFFAGLSRSAPGLAGERTVLGVMPDWNPAEMIGIAPRRLALSLYQRLIGAHAWARARARIGYRDVAPVSLIVALAGRPYVDVRASLSSLLPADVSEPTAHALVEAQLARLCERHDLHDKIEFEVALTCHALDFDARIVDYAAVGLPSAELDGFRRALVSLTDRMLLGRAPRIGDELGRLRTLEERRRQRCAFVPLEASQAARVAVEALDDCAERGVEPFAVLARYAFVAMALLRSLRARGVLSGAEYDALLRAIPTIGSRFSNDVEALRTRQVPATAFLDRYGHLRPSSYEITAPSYAEAPELYLSGGDAPQAEHSAAPSPDDARAIFDAHRVEIDRLLAEAGFEARTDALAGFVVAAIPAREHAKFEFMRTLDSALRALARWGELVGLTREEVSHLPIETIASTASESLSAAARSELSREAAYGRKRWALTRALALPPLITRSADLRRFVLHEARPNFVTSKRVTANVVYVEPGRAIPPLAGRIVVVESADPGYDWVFSHGIAALVTRYGGVASHMCIRAAEFGLPAAIGCGDVLFEQIARAAVVELDCASGTVRVVR